MFKKTQFKIAILVSFFIHNEVFAYEKSCPEVPNVSSCWKCHRTQNELQCDVRCFCTDSYNNQTVSSALQNYDRCKENTISVNNNGQVQCQYNETQLPVGSWPKACGGGVVSGETFTAYCSSESSNNWLCVAFYYENPDSCKKSSVNLNECESYSYHVHDGNLECDR